MSNNPNNGNPSPRRGYDSARHTQEEDHLNRWPFAREIYRIAADGPRDWSVRIGVYLTSNGIECITPAWWERIVNDLPILKES